MQHKTVKEREDCFISHTFPPHLLTVGSSYEGKRSYYGSL